MSHRYREVTAAATRYTHTLARRAGHRSYSVGTGGAWQSRAWHHYSTVPEVRFAARWIGNAMSSARLYAARQDTHPSGMDAAPDDHPAAEAVAAIGGGPTGQSQYLGAYGAHLVVAGEAWTVIRPHNSGMEWRVLSTSEVRRQAGQLLATIDGREVVIPPADDDRIDSGDHIAIRVWDPHPAAHLDADSPVRSALEQLEELELLTAAVKAIARSRLTGRGLVLLPTGTRFPTAPGEAGDAEDDLITQISEVAGIAIREPESAAATVPILLEVPGEMIDKIQHVTFESDFDRIAMELRQEAIRRFAIGLDVPAEILLGMGDVNHWGQWQLSQEAIRLGVEPRLATLSHALTTQWLHPLLHGQGVDDAEEWMVWYDTSPLRVRQNRAATALEVYDRGAISAAALRRETGFDDADAPTSAPTATPEPDTTTNQRPRGGSPVLPADETTTEPALPASAATATAGVPEGLLAAADILISSALTRTGERLARKGLCPRSRRAHVRALPTDQAHTVLDVLPEHVDEHRLLDGAWARVPEVAARYGADSECLTAALDEYCRDLIVTQAAHTWERTPQALADCVGAGADA